MVTTRRTKRTMILHNFTTHTVHTRLTIRVDIGSRKCTSMNPVIHYHKDIRRSRLSRTLKKSPTTLPKSLPLGHHGACIAEQHNLPTSAYWSFFEHRSPRSLRAWRYQQGRRLWTQVHTCFEPRWRECRMLTNVWLHISGKQAAMSLSLCLLHRLYHVIPSRIHFSYPRLGASVCCAS